MTTPATRRFVSLFIFVLLCLLIGAAGGLSTASSLKDWYVGLQKPPLNPPSWVFGPVWTTLYIFIAVAGWRIWGAASSDTRRLKMLYVAQLFLNGIWSFLFFGMRQPLAGLVDIVLLWVCLVLLTTKTLRTDKIAGCLLVPYLLWVSFASYLNAALWWLNR